MNLTDARIVLTGAAGGIGSAIARRLADAGATLLLTDLRQEPLDRLARQARPDRAAHGGRRHRHRQRPRRARGRRA